VNQLLPVDDIPGLAASSATAVTIDLSRIEELDDSISEVIDRFLRNIQVQRQDFNGKVLTIRASDVMVLSMLLDVPDDELVEQIRKQT
jgi:hypothetical protein